MKDKVISLNSGEEYYILEELSYNSKKYALGLKCDLEHDIANEDELELFEISMNDGNLVYITLTKIEKLNKYTSIYQEMEGKKGIIYLDSGDYIEVKEDSSNTNSNDENGENSNSNNNEANPNSNPETNENTQTSNNDVSEDNNTTEQE